MHTIGLDPGLQETGIVLLGDGGHYLAGVTLRASKDGPDLQRIVNLADTVVGTIKAMMREHKITKVMLALEYPILRGGPTAGYAVETYRKQINLLHEIEASLWRWQAEAKDAVIHIAEINPTSSKRAATGNSKATKEEMIYASPFQRREDIKRPTREALADAFCHAIAARLIVGVDRLIEVETLVRERLAPQYVDTKVLKVEVRNDR